MSFPTTKGELFPIFPQPESSPSDEIVQLKMMDTNGIALYQNSPTDQLSDMFDPSSFKGPQGSTYADASIESTWGVFAELGAIHGRYFGLDDYGVLEYMGIPTDVHRIHAPTWGLLDEPDVDILVEQRGFEAVYFPKGNLLISLGVKLRSLTDQQNAAVRILTSKTYPFAAVETVMGILGDEDFCSAHPQETSLISELLRSALDREESRSIEQFQK